MKKTQLNFSGNALAVDVPHSGSFLTTASLNPNTRIVFALVGSLLVHVSIFAVSVTTTIINPPEVLEVRQFEFVDENEKPVEPPKPEPIIKEKSPELTTPVAAATGEAGGTAEEKTKTPGNDDANNPSGGINAEQGAKEVDVNSLGILGELESATDANGSGDVLSVHMQKSDGVVKDLKMSRSLKVGRGQNTQGQVDENALEAISKQGKGIDDLIGRVDAGEGVALRKKGRVNVERIGQVSGSKEALGARSEESLRRVLMDNMGRLQYIYEKHLKTNPDISGKIDVEVTINSDGSVGGVNILKSDIPLPPLQSEILDAVRRWRYDPITSGSMKVVYPVVFVKMG
ncbi:energy transducer TonB [candidate division KSB1 bacterium]|nr:energy transducer TonB [candidate division KSB1 bacterium]